MKDSIDLQISVVGLKNGGFAPQVQFTLWDQKSHRILEEFTWEGEISFEGLSPGVYSVRIAQEERGIGEITLNLK